MPYVCQAICKIISETAQPYIRDYGPKFKLDSIEFESLTLGTLSPTLVGKMQISFPQRRCLEDVLSCTLCLTVVQQIQGSLKSWSSAERFFLWWLGYPGVKAFETNESQMILEPSLKFAGNPNIILAVKAFGLKATVQVCAANGF